MFCPPTAPNRTDKIAAHGACFPIVCAQRRPVQTRTTDTVLNRDQARPPPSAPFPHRHLQAPRGFLLGRFPNAGRCHARRSRPPRPASENLHHSRRSTLTYTALPHSRKLPFVLFCSEHPSKMAAMRDRAAIGSYVGFFEASSFARSWRATRSWFSQRTGPAGEPVSPKISCPVAVTT